MVYAINESSIGTAIIGKSPQKLKVSGAFFGVSACQKISPCCHLIYNILA